MKLIKKTFLTKTDPLVRFASTFLLLYNQKIICMKRCDSKKNHQNI